MTVLVVADLHYNLRWFDWMSSHVREFDLVLIAGDLLDMNSRELLPQQAKNTKQWLNGLATPFVVVSGNHDYWIARNAYDEDSFSGWLPHLRGFGNAVAVDGDTVEIGGITIACNGWECSPDITERFDLLVTHAPPMGCACAVSTDDRRDFGDGELWDCIKNTPPRVIACGHVHSPRALWCRWDPLDKSTLVLNPGYDVSAISPAYWVLDFSKDVACHSSGARVLFSGRAPDEP